MESWQWFLLGMMMALTPSMIVLGLLLTKVSRKSESEESDENHHHTSERNGVGD